jgi:hypothetical protein
MASYNYESLTEPVFLSTKLAKSVSLSRHINSETTSKYHLHCNPLTNSVNLVDGKRVHRVICNYILPQGSSMNFLYYIE